jgi:hypothetical protein
MKGKVFYSDVCITCRCGKDFIWTGGEQSFMHDLVEDGKIQEFTQPKRCPECRAKKKARYGDK